MNRDAWINEFLYIHCIFLNVTAKHGVAAGKLPLHRGVFLIRAPQLQAESNNEKEEAAAQILNILFKVIWPERRLQVSADNIEKRRPLRKPLFYLFSKG